MKKLILLAVCLALTSCTVLPAEERAFAVVLGVTRDSAWHVHARIPTYQNGEYATVTGDGATLDAALASLDQRSPMRISLSQLRLLVLSADIPNVLNPLNTLAKRTDMRLQTAVAVHSGDFAALMEAMSPTTGTRLSKSLDVLRETRIEQGAAPDAILADVVRMGSRQTPTLMKLTLEEGAFDLLGAYPVNASGCLATPLTAGETQLLTMLNGQTKTLQLTLPEAAASLRDVSAKAAWSDGSPTITLTARATQSTESTGRMENALAASALELLTRLSAQGCDALGLGHHAARNALTADDLRAINWPEPLKTAVWTVRVRVHGGT